MPVQNPLIPGALDEREHISLCETLDRVLNKGVVITGEAVISVAGVDLVYLGLRVLLTSVKTGMGMQAFEPQSCRETEGRS